MINNIEGAFLTRHSKKPKGEDKESQQYPGISESGVELARERSMELKDLIEKSEKNSIIFIGGGSDLVRTKSTAEIYGDELKKILSGHQDEILVLTKSEIETMRSQEGKLLETVVEKIKDNPDKKVVIDFPLFLKELSPVRNEWMTKEGGYSEFLLKLLEQNNNDEHKAFLAWLENKGQLGDLHVTSPEQEAENYKTAIERLASFSKKLIPGRPITIGIVGHSWNIDVFIVAMETGGRVDVEDFDRVIGSGIINETEMARISIDDGKVKIAYRGKEYDIKGIE